MEQNRNDQQVWTIGGLSAEQGQCVQGFLTIGNGAFSIPAAIIRGKKPGKTILISAGVHAGEYVGMQSALELARQLDTACVKGNIIIAKVISREMFEGRKGSISCVDGKNLNRVFPGMENGTQTQQFAYALEQELLSVADYMIDLHSGDDYEDLIPYVHYVGNAAPEVVQTAHRMASQVDVPYMVKSDLDTGGFYNYAGKLGIPSVLLERGGMGRWNTEEANSMVRDVRNILIELGIYEQTHDYRDYYPLEVVDVTYQSAVEFGFWYPEKKPGDLIHQNDMLGYVADYEGNVLERVKAEYDGVILYQTGSLQVVKEGPMIAYGRIDYEQKDARKERIVNYWSKRSESFLEQRRGELHDPIAKRWMTEIHKAIGDRKNLRVLDVGCGAGFFSILLAKEGHQVTGIDLTSDMIANAKKLAQEEQADCTFQVMDAEKLEFAHDQFDLVVSRNVVWTLPHADEAYKEWVRVLKKDGILVNFDADYGSADDADKSRLPKNHAHHTIGDDMMLENEAIKKTLPISGYARPAWDLQTLSNLGMTQFQIDQAVGERIFLKQDEFYNPTPIFYLQVQKKAHKNAIKQEA